MTQNEKSEKEVRVERESLPPNELIDIKAHYMNSGLETSLKHMHEKLIGLSSIKSRFQEISSVLFIDNLRKLSKLPALNSSLHMSFSGNPGVGKRSAAKIVASLLKDLGYLSEGHLIEVTRDDLVGQYVGHTAPKTKEQIKKAEGGVLLINEAYHLCKPGNEKDYGPESIEILLQSMENNRDDLVFLFTGQKKKLEPFFTLNPGLASRIGNHLEFEDYNPNELCCIGQRILNQKYHYRLSSKVMLALYISMESLSTSPTFSNARALSNLLLQLIAYQATRIEEDLQRNGELTYGKLTTLEWADFEALKIL